MWPPIGGWLLIRMAAHSRFYCIAIKVQHRRCLHKHRC